MDRSSKFLAYAMPVNNEDEAHQFFLRIRKEHPKAKHYCTAFRVIGREVIERINDDGEPSGTAGKPILAQIAKYGLFNVAIMVVRYWGGSKLGIPGLIEAYKTSAANALETGTKIHRHIYRQLKLQLSYEQLPSFINLCKHKNVPVLDESYNETPELTIGLPRSNSNELLMSILRIYSQMDFDDLDVYLNHLKMKLFILPEDIIL
jgi:uncharacterized YigZ family protein